jgi:hypothetical protein
MDRESQGGEMEDCTLAPWQCESCKHSADVFGTAENGETITWCKRYPPVFVGGDPDKLISWQQPTVLCGDGCSEWAPQTERHIAN